MRKQISDTLEVFYSLCIIKWGNKNDHKDKFPGKIYSFIFQSSDYLNLSSYPIRKYLLARYNDTEINKINSYKNL